MLELRLTAADRAALDEAAKPRGLSGRDYLAFLSQFRATHEELRKRKGPSGEPFRL